MQTFANANKEEPIILIDYSLTLSQIKESETYIMIINNIIKNIQWNKFHTNKYIILKIPYYKYIKIYSKIVIWFLLYLLICLFLYLYVCLHCMVFVYIDIHMDIYSFRANLNYSVV
jgi:hypothetical protein